jgi:polar amino acid transport system substrate-binding protein
MNAIRNARLWALVAVIAALAAVTAGCGKTAEDSSGSTTVPTQEQDTSLSGSVPADVKSKGILRIGTDASYPPFEAIGTDDKTVVGLDADLGKAIGEVLGVRAELVPTAWDGIIPALKSKRIDLIMSAMDDTKERERQVDYVNYMRVPAFGMLVPKGNPKGLETFADLCGRSISVQKGTTQADAVAAANKSCEKPMNVRTFPTESDAQLQVRTGRAVADVTDQVVAVYVASSKGGGKLDSVSIEGQPPSIKGIAVRKADTQLRDAVKAALAKLAESGTYHEILKRWGFPDGAIDEFTINAAGQ